MRRPRAIPVALLLAFAAIGASARGVEPGAATERGAEPGAAIDPWQALQELRLHLAATGELAAPFTQSYVPAGFSTGEEERGEVALALPDCLRWDYSDPYPKSYLLCGARLHSWVRGEPEGQRMRVDTEGQAGLDLLLLPIDELTQRYRATATAAAGSRIAVTLRPANDASSLTEATFELDPSTQRPTRLDYSDREGNRTSFRFGEFGLLDDPARFTPPPAISWREP
jgi:outer membrane lipoprotein-sorting protein